MAPRVSAGGGSSLAARHLAWGDDYTAAAAEAGEAPRLAPEEQFDVVVGSDVMYEHAHARALPGVVARHLAPGGFALLVCGVRFPDVLAAFLARLLRGNTAAPPSREALLAELAAKGVLRIVRPEVAALVRLLEEEFHPLTLTASARPLRRPAVPS